MADNGRELQGPAASHETVIQGTGTEHAHHQGQHGRTDVGQFGQAMQLVVQVGVANNKNAATMKPAIH